jgi:hypothetical protein
MPLITKAKAKQMGIPKKTLQTILFNLNTFDVTTAKVWLKKHNYANSYWRKSANQIRFMQTPDIKDATYYGKRITPNITLIFQEY